LFDQGALVSPRLIAHEIEGSIVDIAQAQVENAEKVPDGIQKQLHLAIAAFLAGAALKDALQRRCGITTLALSSNRVASQRTRVGYEPTRFNSGWRP